ELAGRTRRVIVSLITYYRKTRRRLGALEAAGFRFDFEAAGMPETLDLLAGLARTARDQGLEMMACADEHDYTALGIQPGRCIDGDLIQELWDQKGPWPKDPGQRKACGCTTSRDIGAVDTCRHGCPYCYATASDQAARKNHAAHDPSAPRLTGR
ncbi:MAG: DUF1848 family protein, partial [Thermodesulfobacteriota bacterium]